MKTTNEIALSIIAAIWEAARLRDGCKLDPTLGSQASAIADAWDQVFVALIESERPDPEVPDSGTDWPHRQPLIQQMADAINACMVSVRKGNADAVAAMQASLAKVKAQLSVGANPAPSAIEFATPALLREAMLFGNPTVIQQVGDTLERQGRAEFSTNTRRQLEAASKPQADYESGKAARARTNQ